MVAITITVILEKKKLYSYKSNLQFYLPDKVIPDLSVINEL